MDEDLEFRDMVLKKMEENGSLLDIKAKIRALLYDVIENEHATTLDQPDESDLTSSSFDKESAPHLDVKTLAFELMLETLGSLNLQYTRKILLAESGHRSMGLGSEQLAKQLKLDDSSNAPLAQPVLISLINKLRNGNNPLTTATNANYEEKLTEDTQHSAQHDPDVL
ncbi:uncharacterized protein LOC126564866 [Anopheles maculipalpis]|uniref:uncharacterized protein LOC126564866 n=1 Tax=Anopheles maculipalpis TaxID=1496333 RepID=UPI002159A728|nr:uncharacterized protein LOC126564866 [Anopheles maculipalpis]